MGAMPRAIPYLCTAIVWLYLGYVGLIFKYGDYT